jgi:hypothetical protein
METRVLEGTHEASRRPAPLRLRAAVAVLLLLGLPWRDIGSASGACDAALGDAVRAQLSRAVAAAALPPYPYLALNSSRRFFTTLSNLLSFCGTVLLE